MLSNHFSGRRGHGGAVALPDAHLQPFSGGVAKSERALCMGTGGDVAAIEENIAQAVRTFGPAPGAKKMMEAEKLAAEEAMQTGLYGVWRNATSQQEFCGRIGPMSRCFCGHDYSAHSWDKSKKALRPSCSACACRGFHYIPRRPEEVGEWWLPRRRGFNVHIWRAKCKCSHSHEEHDPNTLGCRCCGCPSFSSAWLCVGCDSKWEDHESLWETEEERRLQGRPVGQAFMPLASTPQIQHMVLNGNGSERSFSLPHRPRPERSVRLMQQRCSHYGGPRALEDGHGSLEDAFPPVNSRRPPLATGPRALESGHGSLEDAFPPVNTRRFPDEFAGGMQDMSRRDREGAATRHDGRVSGRSSGRSSPAPRPSSVPASGGRATRRRP